MPWPPPLPADPGPAGILAPIREQLSRLVADRARHRALGLLQLAAAAASDSLADGCCCVDSLGYRPSTVFEVSPVRIRHA